jgi:hypothetical protein
MSEICKLRIHPAIGIARLGNSPDEHFLAPELPGVVRHPHGGYKDAAGRMKRQAQRFRLFGYDALDRPLGEVTAHDATIRWTVHVANKKAAYHEFEGLRRNTPLRNADVSDRSSLVIDPGPRTLTGANAHAHFDTGKFLGKEVPLGEARTDDRGRLLVFGGRGHSESQPSGRPLAQFANNDGWHDDTSDGPVSAEVTLHGASAPIEVLPAWVIAAPPDFAPAITGIITLYDMLYQRAVDAGLLADPVLPSFTRDIYPLLARAINMRWVSKMAAMSHMTLPPAFAYGTPLSLRRAIFERLRDPALAYNAASDGDMPMIWSDHYAAGGNQPLTRCQYARLQKWSLGQCLDDWSGELPQPSHDVTAHGLDRAALEACVGAAFYPGIEAGWRLRDELALIEPFRLSHSAQEAGDITCQLAVPWQADFVDCTQDGDYAWWPSQRPDEVFPRKGAEQLAWIRDLVDSPQQMVENWFKLGVVIGHDDGFFESERGKPAKPKAG